MANNKKIFIAKVSDEFTKAPLTEFTAQDNEALKDNGEYLHPMSAMIHALAEEGDEVNLIVLTSTDFETTNIFTTEVKATSRARDITINYVDTCNIDGVKDVISIFRDTLDCVEEDAIVHVCTAYMNKLEDRAVQMALKAAYRLQYNNSIAFVVDVKGTKLYDMTALFQLDEISRMISSRRVGGKEALYAVLDM